MVTVAQLVEHRDAVSTVCIYISEDVLYNWS